VTAINPYQPYPFSARPCSRRPSPACLIGNRPEIKPAGQGRMHEWIVDAVGDGVDLLRENEADKGPFC
jgi:hypothetical protein